MDTQGPFRIQTLEDSTKRIRELHFTFTTEFQAMKLENQIIAFEDYLSQLKLDIGKTNDLAIREGMFTVLQISEQLFPHIKDSELPLEETIIVEMGEQTEGTSLTDLVNSAKIS